MSKSITPALKELELMADYIYYGILKDAYEKYRDTHNSYYSSYYGTMAKALPTRPIINIAERGRRKANWWFKPNMWVNNSTQAVAALAGHNANKSFGEITIAAELLTESYTTILENVAYALYGTVHYGIREQLLAAQSTLRSNVAFPWVMPYAYKTGTWKKTYYQTTVALVMPFEMTWDDKKFVPEKPKKALQAVIDAYQVSDLKAFETHASVRTATTNKQVKGTLRKWQCPSCKIPIRASKNIHLVCQCGQQIQYADKDTEDWYKHTRHIFTDAQGTEYESQFVNPADPSLIQNFPVKIKRIDTQTPSDMEELKEAMKAGDNTLPYIPTSSAFWLTEDPCVKCGKKGVITRRQFDNTFSTSFPHIAPRSSSKGPYYVEVTY